MTSLTVLNAATAKFECIFGRGCDGICCTNGRPSIDAEEQARIDGLLPDLLPRLRPEARKVVERDGYLSKRTKLGMPMLRVSGGWCVFFHNGCTMHALGMERGDTLGLKPSQCALFPLERDDDGDWYVRQWGYNGEKWDLFCLNPAATTVPAVEGLASELAYVAEIIAQETT